MLSYAGPILLACISGLALCGLVRTAHLGLAADCVGIALPVALLVWATNSLAAHNPPLEARSPAFVCVLFAAAFAIAALYWCLSFQHAPDGGWDAWMIWNLRARFLGGTDFDLAATLPPALARADFGSHLDYPLLLPLALAELALAFGWHPSIPALVSAAGAVAVVACAWRVAASWREACAAAAVSLALVCTPEFVQAAAAQYAALWLAAFLLLAAEGLLRSLASFDDPATTSRSMASPLAVSGVGFSLAASVKQEGLLWFAAGLFALATATPAGRRLRAVASFLAAAAPLLLVTSWFRWVLAPRSDLAQPLSVALGRIADPARWLSLFAGLSLRVVYFQAWGLWLIAFALAAVWFGRGPSSPRARGLGRLLLVVAVGEVLVYLATPHDLPWHIRTSLDRLLLHAWPLALLWLAARVMPVPTSSTPLDAPPRSAG
ncbi:MAG: hypothetical protein JST92_08880 [Deltaproteobacteria bacterium]|nr:hypothetical protein [Deltaproteobacteria bacterium]